MASPLDLINKARAQSAGEAPSSSGGRGVESPPAAPGASSSVMALVAAASGSNNSSNEGPLVVRDYDLSDAKKDAARVVERIANSQAAQVAMQLAALGLEKASVKASAVAEKAKTSYAKGRAAAKAKAQRFTGESDGSEWINDTLAGSGGAASSSSGAGANVGEVKSRKDSTIDTVRDVLESDLAKTAMTAGAHAFVAAAGSKVGIPPAMSNMAAAETIETGVDHLQKNSSAAATATVEFGMDHLPDAAGVIGGITSAAADTLPGLAADAASTALQAAGIATRLASASLGVLRQASSTQGEPVGDGPEIAVVEEEEEEQQQQQQQQRQWSSNGIATPTMAPTAAAAAEKSSSEDEEASDLSDNEEWEDAK